jgi:RNA polymerase sigma factor (sigma-70 family)
MRPLPSTDQDALLSTLNEHYRTPLFNYFRRRVETAGDAEDLTQDTFVKLLALAETERVQEPGALLFRIAGNLIADRYRKSGRRSKAQLSDLDLAPVSAVSREFIEEQDPERVLLARQRVAAAVKALDELGERTRTIYVLVRLENMPQRQIAELFGISVSSVEKMVMKASVHLIKRLGPRP